MKSAEFSAHKQNRYLHMHTTTRLFALPKRITYAFRIRYMDVRFKMRCNANQRNLRFMNNHKD